MNILVKRVACVAIAGSFVGLLACSNRIAQCNKLIEGVNTATTSIEASSKKLGGTDPKDFGDMADSLDKAGKTIGGVELKDEKLKGYQGDYVKVVGEMATAMRAAKSAIEKKDVAGAAKAQAEFKKADTDEDGVRANITTYCTGG
jgi:hypothetical protein